MGPGSALAPLACPGRRSNSVFKKPDIANLLPSPREAAGRGRGWGVARHTPKQRFTRIDPPPPTPPRHAQGRVEGGEIIVHDCAISQHDKPEVCQKFPALSNRGRGEAGRPMRPIAACARIVVERTRVSQVTPESPGTPRAVVYSLYALSPAIRPGFVTVACASSRKLDASLEASGPHDFTVRFSAVRYRRDPRPPHPHPTSVTIANAPLSGTGWQIIRLICTSDKQKYFCRRGWTTPANHGMGAK
jgi:hypothetical protein